MARSNPYRPVLPNPEQMALRPALAGNAINGLGESAPRRPRIVYWAPDPDAIPHGAMQRWFYQVNPDNPHLARARAVRAQVLQPATGPMTTKLALLPPAIACSIGELGKHGSLINPEYGAPFRLSAVLTDAPIAPTPTRSFGVDKSCRNYRVCEDACPLEAIGPDQQLVRGTRKWYVDFDRCLPFFNQHHGCAICIAVCPMPPADLRRAAPPAPRSCRRAGLTRLPSRRQAHGSRPGHPASC